MDFFPKYLWHVKVVLSCLTSSAVGWLLVQQLRMLSKRTEKIWKLIVPIFVTPLAVYMILHFSSLCNQIDRVVADAFSFGIVVGILLKLNTKPSSLEAVKLILYTSTKCVEIWLPSKEILVNEARRKIGEVLRVQPIERIAIESGKGSIIDDFNAKFIPLISSEKSVMTDFFGFLTISCCVTIREHSPAMNNVSDTDSSIQTRVSNYTIGALINPKVKYADQLFLSARNPTATSDAKPFDIQPIDKFAAASPSTALGQQARVIRLMSWSAATAAFDASELLSDAGEVAIQAEKAVPFRAKPARDESDPYVRHGDTVVVNCDEKFMSVTKGWWMAWSSTAPRRSGAFTIEIMERPQTLSGQIMGGIETIKEKMGRPSISLGMVGAVGGSLESLSQAAGARKEGGGKGENTTPLGDASAGGGVLRAGDLFRLRSVKFPDYELGVTCERIRGEFCYLGLRKVGALAFLYS